MDQEVKTISSDAEKRPEQVAKYTAKDSVFTSLFREPKYLLQLYQALHPEDHEATEDSIKNVTITNVLLDQYYNDVGFQIGEKIVILVEQQSSWSINIVVRCLLYLAQTYQSILRAQNRMCMGVKNWSFQNRKCTSFTQETERRGRSICICRRSFLAGMTVCLM